uniref:Uncharacterized protein n=1 Tax=Arundo donax TaxID=35708 RepID=A0A0A9B8Q6_ARUDO
MYICLNATQFFIAIRLFRPLVECAPPVHNVLQLIL